MELGISIRRLENHIFHNPFCRVTKAKKLADAGCESIYDLRNEKFAPFLSKAQMARFKYVGVKQYRTKPREAEDVLV
jgi:hypothetical protein